MVDSLLRVIGSKAEWRALPDRMRHMIRTQDLSRLTRLRDTIAEESRLPMPPAHVEPYAWITPRSQVIFARMTPLALKRGEFHLGVQLPAATLVASDDLFLRRVLCHEFGHVFWLTTEILHALDKGKTEYTEVTPPILIFRTGGL
jgi:hypothetical protein